MLDAAEEPLFYAPLKYIDSDLPCTLITRIQQSSRVATYARFNVAGTPVLTLEPTINFP
jgi:hypothetical protein